MTTRTNFRSSAANVLLLMSSEGETGELSPGSSSRVSSRRSRDAARPTSDAFSSSNRSSPTNGLSSTDDDEYDDERAMLASRLGSLEQDLSTTRAALKAALAAVRSHRVKIEELEAANRVARAGAGAAGCVRCVASRSRTMETSDGEFFSLSPVYCSHTRALRSRRHVLFGRFSDVSFEVLPRGGAASWRGRVVAAAERVAVSGAVARVAEWTVVVPTVTPSPVTSTVPPSMWSSTS